MKQAKFFIAFTFLLAFAVCVSAQDQTPKIVWKNLQEKYESFEDVKPVLVNESNMTIFMFADVSLGVVYDYLELYRYFEDSGNNWRTIIHGGHPVNKKYQEKIMSNVKLESQQERPIVFDNEDWLFLTESDGVFPASSFIGYENRTGVGKYKFNIKLYYKEKNKLKNFTVESPVFEITKEQKSFFNR